MNDDERTPLGDTAPPAEPFAWMTNKKPVGPYRMTLTTPLSEALLGAFLIGSTVLFAVVLLGDPSVPSILVAVLLIAIFGGLGAVLIVMAIARGRWVRAYERFHGHRPF